MTPQSSSPAMRFMVRASNPSLSAIFKTASVICSRLKRGRRSFGSGRSQMRSCILVLDIFVHHTIYLFVHRTNSNASLEVRTMKAAVIHEFGSLPLYEDFSEPTAETGDVLIQVKAAVLENFDKMAAQGVHYASKRMFPQFPAIVGHSGVGTLTDGTLVAFGGSRPPYGTMAEIAIVPKEYAGYLSPVPEGVDAALAAALPASAMTSYLPLKWGAKLEPGQSVLILGATGVSGQLAVRIASLLGAGRVVAAGREASILESLREIGAGAIIDLKLPDAEVYDAFVRESGDAYDVILDFLWGHPTELLFRAITPSEVGFAKHK